MLIYQLVLNTYSHHVEFRFFFLQPPEEEMEFSDDEKEMEAKLARKQAKKGQSATAGQASADATFGDAIPPGGRFGANKRNLQGGRPNATRPAGHSSAGTGAVSYPQHQQFPPQAMPQHGYYPQQPPGAPMPPQAYGAAPPAYGMNPVYMGAPYMPQQQQAFYGQAPMPFGMPYGAPTPVGYPMQQQYAPAMHAYPAQQPMYPPQPPTGHMMPPQQQQQQQYAPQPG